MQTINTPRQLAKVTNRLLGLQGADGMLAQAIQAKGLGYLPRLINTSDNYRISGRLMVRYSALK